MTEVNLMSNQDSYVSVTVPWLAVRATAPRLLGLEDAAKYLGVSEWTVRSLEWEGVLPRVRIPNGKGGELRKLLFDREDLDRLIERWKDAPNN
jgi:excisionase family DNA binding protein